MKILLVNLTYKPHHGGVENSLYYIGKRLIEEKHEVIMLTSDRGLEVDSPLPSRQLIDGIQVYRYKRNNKKNILYTLLQDLLDVISMYHLGNSLRNHYRPDIIIARDMKTGLGALMAFPFAYSYYIIPSAIKYESITNTQNIKTKLSIKHYLKRTSETYSVSLRILFQHILMKIVDQNILFSKNMESQFNMVDIGPNIKYSILPPGVDSKKFCPPKEHSKVAIRAHLSLPIDATIVLILGRIVRAKGIDILISSLKLIKNDSIKLVVVGDGPEVVKLESMARDYFLSSQIVFVKSSNSPELYYQASDIFALPSIYEPFGQTLLEALASGLPILAFDSEEANIFTATSEIMENNINGVLTKYSITALAEGLERLAGLPEKERLKISQNNRAMALEKYSWDTFTDYLTSDCHRINLSR